MMKSRQEAERRLAKAIQQKFGGKAAEAVRLLGNPPDIANIPDSFWAEMGADLRSALEPELAAIAGESGSALKQMALAKAKKQLVKVDWKQANQAASSWAKDYSFDLVKQLNANSQAALQTAVSGYYQDSQTLDQLAAGIEDIFGPYRSAMIAITETTRASVEGDKAVAAEIEAASSIRMTSIFHTEVDETVCEECGPMDGKEVDESDYPPLHPNCRCYITWEMAGLNE